MSRKCTIYKSYSSFCKAKGFSRQTAKKRNCVELVRKVLIKWVETEKTIWYIDLFDLLI